VILVLRDLGLGDLMTGVPALRALRRQFPEELLVLVGPAALGPLAVHATGVDLVVERSDAAGLPAPTLAVNLHGRGPQSTAWLAGLRPGDVVAFDLPGAPEWRDAEHDRSRWCRLLVEAGVVASATADCHDLLVRRPPGEGALEADTTVLHPGAAAAARRWPAERWAAVAAAESGLGRPVVITGSAMERDLGDDIATAAGLGPGAVLAGATTPLDLLVVIGSAGRLVCGDTGVAHLATAAGTPSVVLFGPVPPSRWGPPTWGPHVALWAGQLGDPHAIEPDPGLLEIGVDDVLSALRSLGGRRDRR
jgi:ADP-heptose:LPS heptosyltransferase